MFDKILVCLDGSILAEQILSLVEAQAKQFQSQVFLLQVVPPGTSHFIEAGAAFNEINILDEQDRINFERATTYLENVSLSLKAKSIHVQSVVLRSSPVGKAILNFAAENKISLIAIATHGHGGLGSLVFGSVANYILKESGLPMLVIKPK